MGKHLAKSIRDRRPSPALIVALIALIVALGGVAIAAIPSADGTIHACYNAQGQLRVIDAESGASCAPGETALNWNQTGPAGPPGPSQATLGAHDKSVGIASTDTTVARLDVTSGSYVVLAKLDLTNVGPNEVPVSCTLHAGSDTDSNYALLRAPTIRAPTQSMSFEVVHRFTASRVIAIRVGCHFKPVHGKTITTGDVVASNTRITAIQVDSVSSHVI